MPRVLQEIPISQEEQYILLALVMMDLHNILPLKDQFPKNTWVANEVLHTLHRRPKMPHQEDYRFFTTFLGRYEFELDMSITDYEEGPYLEEEQAKTYLTSAISEFFHNRFLSRPHIPLVIQEQKNHLIRLLRHIPFEIKVEDPIDRRKNFREWLFRNWGSLIGVKYIPCRCKYKPELTYEKLEEYCDLAIYSESSQSLEKPYQLIPIVLGHLHDLSPSHIPRYLVKPQAA